MVDLFQERLLIIQGTRDRFVLLFQLPVRLPLVQVQPPDQDTEQTQHKQCDPANQKLLFPCLQLQVLEPVDRFQLGDLLLLFLLLKTRFIFVDDLLGAGIVQ